jgi:hypothetical protein
MKKFIKEMYPSLIVFLLLVIGSYGFMHFMVYLGKLRGVI